MFRGARDEVGYDRVDGDAFSGNHDAGLTGRSKGCGNSTLLQVLGEGQGRVFLAEGAIRPDRQDPLAAAFAAARGAVSPLTVAHIDKPDGASRGGLHQLGEGGQARVKTAHDIEAGIGRFA